MVNPIISQVLLLISFALTCVLQLSQFPPKALMKMSQFYKTRNCNRPIHKIKAQDDQIMRDFTIFYFKNIFKIFHVVNERNERA